MVNTNFMDNGAAGTTADLFTNVYATMGDVPFTEIYGALSPVLAKQYVNLPDTPDNPVTNAFIGEALKYGTVIEDIFVESTPMRATKVDPKSLGDAVDELGFADVTMVKNYHTINALNTGKVSKYMYEINKASQNASTAGTLGESIIASLRVGQVACLENQAAKVMVSSTSSDTDQYCGVTEADDDDTRIMKERRKLIDIAMEMSKVGPEFTEAKYPDGAAREIYIFAPKNKWAEIALDKAGVFHPEFLEFNRFANLGIKITPVVTDRMLNPLTTDEITQYHEMSDITWNNAPGLGAETPDYFVCDKRYMRINPFIDRYQMFSKDVVGNLPFTNFFLHMQNAISYQPCRKACRVYSGEEPE